MIGHSLTWSQATSALIVIALFSYAGWLIADWALRGRRRRKINRLLGTSLFFRGMHDKHYRAGKFK